MTFGPDMPTSNTPNVNVTPGYDWWSPQGVGTVLSGVGNIAGAWAGLQNYGLARDQYNFNRDLSLTNLGNQANITNSQIYDRQMARNARGQGIPVEEYMARYGVSGSLAGYGQPNNSNAVPPGALPAPAPAPTNVPGNASAGTSNPPNINFGV